MFTFLERYLSRMSVKSMPVDLDAVKPFIGFCTAYCSGLNERARWTEFVDSEKVSGRQGTSSSRGTKGQLEQQS